MMSDRPANRQGVRVADGKKRSCLFGLYRHSTLHPARRNKKRPGCGEVLYHAKPALLANRLVSELRRLSTAISAKRDRMATQRAGLLSLPFLPEAQDRRAFRAEDRRRLDWHRWLSGGNFPNTGSPGLRIVPKDGGSALLVSEFDLLIEIDAGD